MRRFTSLAASGAAVVGLASGLAACGGGSSNTTSTTSTTASTASSAAGGAPTTITIKNFAYQPPNLTVKAGSKVTVQNNDSATHTVTANNNAFDTGNVNNGASKTLTAPSNPGSFAYHCTIHPFMHGTLTVTS